MKDRYIDLLVIKTMVKILKAVEVDKNGELCVDNEGIKALKEAFKEFEKRTINLTMSGKE